MASGVPRMTKAVVTKLLELNEGFATSTHYAAKNFSETRHYVVRGGQLFIRSVGKTSWADSRFDKEILADADQVRRFLKSFYGVLKSKGLD